MRAGCGTPHAGGYSNGKSTHNLEVAGNTRYYTIDVPENYNDKRNDPWPLILDFHGANKDAANQYNNSQYFAEPRGEDDEPDEQETAGHKASPGLRKTTTAVTSSSGVRVVARWLKARTRWSKSRAAWTNAPR